MYLFVSTALSCLDVLFKYYNLSLSSSSACPVPPSCVHRDRRPDQNRKRRHSPRFVFRFEKFLFCSSVYVCLSRGMEVAARHSRHSPLQVGVEFGGIAASPRPRALMPADRGRYSSPGGGSPKPAGSLLSSRVAAPPGAPFAGDHATASPLTQCPPARL